MGAIGNGIIVLDKPAGMTSQDAVSVVRRKTGIRKIGHTGTLDKFATGVLPLMVGDCTRLSRFVLEGRKRYLAEFLFGVETDTLDPEGSPVRNAEPPTREALEACLPRFMGQIVQVPPEYSAISIGGKRAYRMARSGESPKMEGRRITVSSFGLLAYDGRTGSFDIECSKGTYIRSLARDVARDCGSAAHVIALRRVFTGGFGIEDAIPIDSVLPESPMPFKRDIALRVGLGIAVISDARIDDFRNGKGMDPGFFADVERPEAEFHAVYSSDGELCGVVRGAARKPTYEVVLGRRP